MNINDYFEELERKVKVAYSVSEEARRQGLDPLSKVEIPIATSLAERVTGLVSTLYPQLNNPQLVKRILELEKMYGSLDPAVSLKISEEIAKQKFCKFQSLLEGIDAGIRIGLAYLTLGVVSSPIEGFTNLKLGKTKNGEDYFIVYYSGPIRSAGGTGAAFSLVIIDHLREIFGYARYDPTKEEVKRAVTEIYDYHERVTNLQYLPNEEEIEFLAAHLSIQIAGEASETREVSNYKDLERVETNFIRSGFCLAFAEGLAQKAPKILKMILRLRKKGFKLSAWSFLQEFIDLQKRLKDEKKKEAGALYIKDLVAGRPVLGHPSASGTFRLRYGRTRVSGYSALAIHPATMQILNGFIAIGSQIKIERPTKGAALAVCDSVEGPVVRFFNGNVKRIENEEEAREAYKDVEEILYLGDLLVPYGDFVNRNHVLMPVGYTEQQWYVELKEKGKKEFDRILKGMDIYNVDFESACKFSEEFAVALHPCYTFYWSQISYDEFLGLVDWLGHATLDNNDRQILLPYNKRESERFAKGKRALELLAVEHSVTIENVIIKERCAKIFLVNLGISPSVLDNEKHLGKYINEISKRVRSQENVLDVINQLSDYEIRDRAGTFIGARMGRPEKAKLRKLVGSPHVLFPVGSEGGRLRSVQEACSVGSIKADFPIYYCENCQKESVYFICENCLRETKKMYYCPECQQRFFSQICPRHSRGQSFCSKRIDSNHYFKSAVGKLGLHREEIPVLVKGVRGTSSANHVPENLAKGLLRALFNLHVNKDGTIRFDATELPLTHFKPREIGTSVELLREMGYDKDVNGKALKSDEQIVEIKPHDIILPACPDSLDEKGDEVFMNIANFIDSLLVRFYKLRPFYNVRSREDLIGHLVACIAPHNCASVVGRIIGFSKTQALLASPYIHAAMRRDCDGDEASIMLLLDMLINFSQEFLPAHRGGTQDAPLVLNARIRAGEVDDMIFDVDVSKELPVEFYEAANRMEHPSKVKIEQLKDRLGKNREFNDLYYSYETSNLNAGILCSAYKKLVTMREKVEKQMELVEKIRAVNTSDVARLIIERHFIRDIRGNLRKFSSQEFRCVKCNEKYRRPPLTGKCLRCQGRIIFTISEGSIVKYLEPAVSLAEKYAVPAYIKQSLELTRSYIESIFGRESERQVALEKWFDSSRSQKGR